MRALSVSLALASAYTGPAETAPAYVGRVTLLIDDATSAAIADFDRDGFADVAVLSGLRSTFAIYRGRGDGTFFHPPETHAAPPAPVQILARPINGDLFPDLVIVSTNASVLSIPIGDVEVFFNTGNVAAMFLDSPPACGQLYLDHCSITDGTQPRAAVIAMLDGDASPDIVAASGLSNTFNAFYSTMPTDANPCGIPGTCQNEITCGLGIARCRSFGIGAQSPVDLEAQNFWTAMPFGRPANVVDVITLNAFPDPALVRYHFKANNDASPFINVSQSYQVGDGTTTGLGATAVVPLQIDADGKLDIAVSASRSNQVSVLLNTSTSTFTDRVFSLSTEYPAGPSPAWIEAGDFVLSTAGTSDGVPDVVVANESGDRVSVLKNRRLDALPGDLRALAQPAWWDGGQRPTRLVVGLVDGGTLEDVVVVGGEAASVLIARAMPNGGFDTAPRYQLPAIPTAVVTGDFDGDSTIDAAVALDTPEIRVWRSDGSGQLSAAFFPTPLAAPANDLAAGLIDADLRDDLVVAGDDGVRVLFAADNGSFWDAQRLGPGAASSVVVAPFDGTSIAIAATFPDTGQVCSFVHVGCGQMLDAGCVSVGGQPTWIAAGDFDQSNAATCPGCLDLAILDPLAGTLAIARREADGAFSPGAPQPTGATAPVGLTAANFDADAIADVAVVDDRGNVQVFIGTGTTTVTQGQAIDLGGPLTTTITSGELDATPGTDLAVLHGFAGAVTILPGINDGTFDDATRVAYGVGYETTSAAVGLIEPGAYSGVVAVAAGDLSLTYLGPTRKVVFPPADAGQDVAVGPTDSVVLGASSADTSSLTYSWAPTTGLTGVTTPTPTLDASMLSGDTQFTVTVTHADTGLVATDQVDVVFRIPPTPTIIPANPLCCAGGAPARLEAPGNMTAYAWSTGETARCIDVCPAVATMYDVVVTNWAGESAMAQVLVGVGVAPTVTPAIAATTKCEESILCTSTALLSTIFPIDAGALPAGATASWSLVGSPAGWSVAAPSAPTTEVCVATPVAVTTATLRLTVTAADGCAVVDDIPLEVVPSAATSGLDNRLRATKLPGNGAHLEWVAVAANQFDGYVVEDDKTLIPTMIAAPNLFATTAGTFLDDPVDRDLGFYQLTATCN